MAEVSADTVSPADAWAWAVPVAGAAAALLVAKLFRRAVDFAARLGLVGALLALVELPLDNPVNDVNARLETKNVVCQLD
mgnify:CR=1 FL=1